MALHVLGVRHHSPACARLVEASIRSLRPRWVLIEGPADMNGRLDELLLDHEPPIALFTFYHREERTHASWAPFCRSSPEWVALRTAREVGATPPFMDLPAWTHPFEGVHNRYGDHHEGDERIARLLDALCARFQVDDPDALWDHLFELPLPLEELAARLDAYFEELRGDLPGGPRDGPREDFMLRFLGWALAEAEAAGGDVVAVCGGFHAPVLRREARPDGMPGGAPPVPPAPEEGARSGSYLVPYSFHLLDSFTGYERSRTPWTRRSPGATVARSSRGPIRSWWRWWRRSPARRPAGSIPGPRGRRCSRTPWPGWRPTVWSRSARRGG